MLASTVLLALSACGDALPSADDEPAGELRPSIEAATSRVQLGQSLPVTIRANDPAATAGHRFDVSSTPALGAVSPASNLDGQFTYTARSEPGLDRFTVTVTDIANPDRTGQVSVEVTVADGSAPVVNAPPRADDATYSIGDAAITIDLNDISADPDGPGARFEIVSGPNRGTLDQRRLDEGLVEYTPSVTGPTTDSFVYRRTDEHPDDPRSAEGTVVLNIRGAAPQPDIVVSSVSAASSARIGGKMNVRFELANRGAADAGPFKAGVFFSTDDRISRSGDTLAAQCELEQGLGGQQTTSCEGEISVPSDLSAGRDYYVGVYADLEDAVTESDEGNNARTASNRVRIEGTPQPSEPDLVVSAVSVPSSATAGGRISVRVEVRNTGDAAAGPFETGLYFSTNDRISSNDTLAGTCNHSRGAAAGTTRVCDFEITVPRSLSGGQSYYFGAYADHEKVIDESNDANNARTASNRVAIRTSGSQGTAPASLSGRYSFSTAGTQVIELRAGGYGTQYTSAGSLGVRYSYVRQSSTRGSLRVWQIIGGVTSPNRYDDFQMTFTSATSGTCVHTGESSIGRYGPLSGTFRRL